MKVSCPRCGKENTDDVRFCLGCGAELQARGAGGRSAGPPKINAPPPLGMARPAGPPLAAPVAAAPAGPPGFGAPPPLAPPVAAPAAANGPPLFGPMPPIGAPAGNAPPAIGLAGAPAGLGALPPLNAVGNVAPAPMGPPAIAPPSLGALPPVGARPAAPVGPPPPSSGLGLGGLPPLGGMGAPAAPPAPSGLGLGPMPPIGAPVAQPPAASPGLGLGPLPPIAAPPAAGPAFSAPAVPNAQPGPPANLGGLPPLGPPQPAAPAGLGGLPPLGPPQPGPPANLGGMPQPGPPANLGGLPPLAPQPPASTRLPTGTGAAYGASTGNDPFGNSSDPFASNGDPFAVSTGGAAPPYNAPSDMYLAAADPYAAQQPGPPAQRQRTIGPGGAMPVPPVAPGPRGQFGQTSMQQGGDPWSAPRIEPEIEDSRTHVGPAVGRPKLLITQLDGTEEGEFPLKDGENVIGRETGGIFAKDNLLSGRHATFIVQGSSVWIRDDGSRNGVYVRLPRQQHVELSNGDQFCIGRIILRFELQPAPDSVGLLHLVVGRDVDKALFPFRVPMSGLTMGRNRADLKFPTDGWVSGLHCQIVVHGPQVMIVDLGSSNGTYHRIRSARPLVHHDAVLMGQRIFHLHCP